MLSKSLKLIVSFGLFLSATLSAQALDSYYSPQVMANTSLKYNVHTVEYSLEGIDFEIEVFIYGDGAVNIFPPRQITKNNTRITIEGCRYNKDETITCSYTKEQLVETKEELNPYFFDGSIAIYLNNDTKETYKKIGTNSFTTNKVR
jgi:hypothetical protein